MKGCLHFLMCRFWANMYLAQFYDDTVSASRHPSIVIDQGFMAVSQGAYNYEPVGDTGNGPCMLLLSSSNEQGIMPGISLIVPSFDAA